MNAVWFGEVRSALAGEADAAGWARLCALLSSPDAEARAEEWLPYVSAEAARRWPDAARVAPRAWVERAVSGELPAAWPLVRACVMDGLLGGDAQLVRLVERGVFAALTDIHMARCGLTTAGLEALLAAERRHLRALWLAGNSFPDWATLFYQELDTLEVLDLSACDLSARVFEGLYCGGSVEFVRDLNVDYNPNISNFNEVSGWMSKLACSLDRLESLSMRGCEERGEWLGALSENRALERIRCLDVSENPLRADGLKILLDASMPALRQLRLSRAQLGSREARALASASWASGLEVLALDGNDLGEEGYAALAQSPRLSEALRRQFV